MADAAGTKCLWDSPKAISRRNFIKGVVAGGVAVSSASYLFRACTVLIDDVPHYSCSVLTHTVRAKKVQTIEGLATANGTLHPVQQAVLDQQGFQCAFCMSGFIMATVGFLKTNP